MKHLCTIFEGETGEIPVKYGAVSYKWKVTNDCAGSLVVYRNGKEINFVLVPMKQWFEFWK